MAMDIQRAHRKRIVMHYSDTIHWSRTHVSLQMVNGQSRTKTFLAFYLVETLDFIFIAIILQHQVVAWVATSVFLHHFSLMHHAHKLSDFVLFAHK